MSKIGIETTQNVYLQLPLASIGERIAAYFIDLIFMAVLAAFCMMLYGILGESFTYIFIILIPLFVYTLLFETFMNGQTPGKRIMNIKVCVINGQAPTFWNFAIRWMFRLVDIFLFNGVVAVLIIVLGEKGQRLGDILAKTTVVKTHQKLKFSSTIYTKVPDDYQLVFSEVKKVEDKDLQLFQRVLSQLKTMDDPVEKLNFGLKARKTVADKLGIKTEMPPEKFFQTLLKDYNYYYQNK